jgi:coenzyme F420-reducing hydrogenase beta subunit
VTAIEEKIQKYGLCIGCGLCAAICPNQAIVMQWGKNLTWAPVTDAAKCTNCGLCGGICPNTPECICKYASAAAQAGERFGLPGTGDYFIGYDMNPENRIRSASGGALTAILMYLLETSKIDGVLASVSVPAEMGKPHFRLKVLRLAEELDAARSSHYYPLCYAEAIREVKANKGVYGLVGTPCVIRGIKRLPAELQKRIKYTFSLVCSHNVTGRFLDCLAKQEGVPDGQVYTANLRDKLGGISDANNFNTYFRLPDREIRRNRFSSAFTDMWRNYFFAQECCLYCPDFYGVDADVSVKDGWGRLSGDPLGISLLIVRNPELAAVSRELKESGRLYLEACNAEEVLQSDALSAKFKHIELRERLVWKAVIRRELSKNGYLPGTSRLFWKEGAIKYRRFRIIMALANYFYTRGKYVPVHRIITVGNIAANPVEVFLNKMANLKRAVLGV